MSSMKMIIGAFSLAAVAVASDASAFTRQVSAGATLVPGFTPSGATYRAFWGVGVDGWARVAGQGFASDYAYGVVSIPVDSTFGTGLGFSLRAFGGQAGVSQMCFAAYSVTTTGVISAFTSSACTSGVTATDQTLGRSLNITNSQAVFLSIAGQNLSIAKYLNVSY